MGQYYYVVNLDKREYLYPHKFGDGLKLCEFGASGCGTMLGLAVLLSNGNGGGGGDIDSDDEIIGSWAGDRIVLAGDYGDCGRFIPNDVSLETLRRIARKSFSEGYQQPERVNLHHLAQVEWTDISDRVLAALKQDEYLAENLRTP